jgi:Uma2 family endonuclease
MAIVTVEERSSPVCEADVSSPIASGLDPFWTLADLQTYLDDIPLDRIRLFPSPGRATEQDFLLALDQKRGLAELVDGTLVEKPVGFFESRLSFVLAKLIDQFIGPQNLGVVFTADCPVRMLPAKIRLPDVSFFRWTRFPDGKLPEGQVMGIVPDLAVEVISPANTKAEMDKKRLEYFTAGVTLVWYIYPKTQSVLVYTSPEDFLEFTDPMKLDGGTVLPGFELIVKSLFDQARGVS